MRLSRTERLLRIFTDVRPGEGPTALLLFANVFLILCAYYFIKPLREGWIAISPIEGFEAMEGLWDRSTLITRATFFCISNMVIFWFLQPNFFFGELPWTGIVFFLWVGMFGVFVVAQFWTFCADIYTEERGKRMLPFVAIGATSGAAGGSWIVAQLSGMIGVKALLLVAILPLLASIVLTRIADARERASAPDPKAPPPEPVEAPPDQGIDFLVDGAKLVLVSRFMLAAAAVTLLVNWVNTNGENLLTRVVQEGLTIQAAEQGLSDPVAVAEFRQAETTEFYGDFFFWVNFAALLLQAVVASRLLKYGGFAAIVLMLPVIALVSYATMALLPVLAIVKVMKIAENATDYSINNTSRHVLWLPVSSEMKFRGKPAIDTLYVRMGDGLAAATVLVGVQWLALATEMFFVLNVALVLAWFGFAALLIREHRKASEANSSDESDGLEIRAPSRPAAGAAGVGRCSRRRRRGRGSPARSRSQPGSAVGGDRGPDPEGHAGPRRDRPLRGQGAPLGLLRRDAPEEGGHGDRGARARGRCAAPAACRGAR
jgi:AAA family ATP:ADP antiporter